MSISQGKGPFTEVVANALLSGCVGELRWVMDCAKTIFMSADLLDAAGETAYIADEPPYQPEVDPTSLLDSLSDSTAYSATDSEAPGYYQYDLDETEIALDDPSMERRQDYIDMSSL